MEWVWNACSTVRTFTPGKARLHCGQHDSIRICVNLKGRIHHLTETSTRHVQAVSGWSMAILLHCVSLSCRLPKEIKANADTGLLLEIWLFLLYGSSSCSLLIEFGHGDYRLKLSVIELLKLAGSLRIKIASLRVVELLLVCSLATAVESILIWHLKEVRADCFTHLLLVDDWLWWWVSWRDHTWLLQVF